MLKPEGEVARPPCDRGEFFSKSEPVVAFGIYVKLASDVLRVKSGNILESRLYLDERIGLGMPDECRRSLRGDVSYRVKLIDACERLTEKVDIRAVMAFVIGYGVAKYLRIGKEVYLIYLVLSLSCDRESVCCGGSGKVTARR